MEFKKIAFMSLGLSVGLIAGMDYAQGIKHYQAGEYDKAFPIILEKAKADNKAAQYRLAEMYEQGLGTKVDYQASSMWYKKAAEKYAFAAAKKQQIQRVLLLIS